MIDAGPGSPYDDTALMVEQPPAPARPATARIEFGAATHVGKVRPNNEDQYLVARLVKSLRVLATSLPGQDPVRKADDEAHLLLVADGMGGAAAGERASALVVEGVQTYVLEAVKWFFHAQERDESARLRDIRAALNWLDQLVFSEARADRTLAGMGTTLTSAIVLADELTLIHVGDSRAYLYHGGGLEQVTHDHTLTQMMVDAGEMKPEEARRDRRRNVVTNVLGGPAPGVTAEVHRLRLHDGDRLLLCTDGLTDPVRDERIADLLGRNPDPQDACRALIDAALEGGGPDNITVVVANFVVAQSGG